MLNIPLPAQLDDVASTLTKIVDSNCRELSTSANYLLKNLSNKTSRESFTEHYNEIAHMLVSEYNRSAEVKWFVDECVPTIQALLPTPHPSQTLKRGEKLMFELPYQPKPPLTVLYSMQDILEPTVAETESNEGPKKNKHCCHVL